MIISASTEKVFETTGFRSEKELQDTIEKLPSLLNAISQLNRQDYPLFILKREFGVSSGSMDFLAVDGEGSLYEGWMSHKVKLSAYAEAHSPAG